MQNNQNILYITGKIINLRSEILYREAQDDFFYFNKTNLALAKLLEAVKLTPSFVKALLLCSDIYFIKGQFNKSLQFALEAFEYNPYSLKAAAAIANGYCALKKFSLALEFCEKALNFVQDDNDAIYSQIIEIKINSLIGLKKYKQAYMTFIQCQSLLEQIDLLNIYNQNFYLINQKIKLQKKLMKSNLKIV